MDFNLATQPAALVTVAPRFANARDRTLLAGQVRCVSAHTAHLAENVADVGGCGVNVGLGGDDGFVGTGHGGVKVLIKRSEHFCVHATRTTQNGG